jgi:hypothetical protein
MTVYDLDSPSKKNQNVEADALMWSREGITLQDFYAALLDSVKNAEKHREEGRQATMRLSESRQRILGGIDDENLREEVDVLLTNVSFLFYRRGYKDAEHHRKALNPVRRTPERHQEFKRAVTKMLESDIEMEISEICTKLDRLGVTSDFKIRGETEEVGPDSWPWKHRPIPGAISGAIERIRTGIRRENYARERQSLLSHRKAKPATQGN